MAPKPARVLEGVLSFSGHKHIGRDISLNRVGVLTVLLTASITASLLRCRLQVVVDEADSRKRELQQQVNKLTSPDACCAVNFVADKRSFFQLSALHSTLKRDGRGLALRKDGKKHSLDAEPRVSNPVRRDVAFDASRFRIGGCFRWKCRFFLFLLSRPSDVGNVLTTVRESMVLVANVSATTWSRPRWTRSRTRWRICQRVSRPATKSARNKCVHRKNTFVTRWRDG